jgi:large subunit ribosomal protein L21
MGNIEQEKSNQALIIMEKRQFEKYALFQSGGKQYQAIEGKTLALEKLDNEVGEKVLFHDVLLRRISEALEVGQPFLSKPIEAVVIKQTRAPKITVLKFKRRKKYKVKQGHRQAQTIVRFEVV